MRAGPNVARCLSAAALIAFASTTPRAAVSADLAACIAAPSAACIAALIDLPQDGPDAPNWGGLVANLAAAGRLEAARGAAAPLANDRRGRRWAAETLAWRTVEAEAKARPGAVASFAPIERLGADPSGRGDDVVVTLAYPDLVRSLIGHGQSALARAPVWLAAAEEVGRAQRRRMAFPATLPAALDAWEAAIRRLPESYQASRWVEFGRVLLLLNEDEAARRALQEVEAAHLRTRNNGRENWAAEEMRAWLRLGEPLPAFEAALYVQEISLPGRSVPGRLAEVAEGALAAAQPDVARSAAQEAHRHARDLREAKPWIEPSVLYRLIKAQAAAGDRAGARAMAEDWLRWARASGLWRASNLATAAAAFDGLGDAEQSRSVLYEALGAGAVERRAPGDKRLRDWKSDGRILAGGHTAEIAAIGFLSLGDLDVAGRLLSGLDARIRQRVVEPVFVARLADCGEGAPPLAEQAARVAEATFLESGPTGLLLAATAECLRRGAEAAVAQGLAAARAALDADAAAWAEWRFLFARLAAAADRRDLVSATLSRATSEALAIEHPGRRADALGVAAAHAAALLD